MNTDEFKEREDNKKSEEKNTNRDVVGAFGFIAILILIGGASYAHLTRSDKPLTPVNKTIVQPSPSPYAKMLKDHSSNTVPVTSTQDSTASPNTKSTTAETTTAPKSKVTEPQSSGGVFSTFNEPTPTKKPQMDTSVDWSKNTSPNPTYKPSVPNSTIDPGVGSGFSSGSDDLGKLSKNKYNSDVLNQYDSNSVNNKYGTYGNPYSSYSATNPYTSDAPKLYDSEGNYRGKLSANPYDTDSISNPYGQYGSKYSPDSINNPYGAGSKYKSDSPNNPYGSGWSIVGQGK